MIRIVTTEHHRCPDCKNGYYYKLKKGAWCPYCKKHIEPELWFTSHHVPHKAFDDPMAGVPFKFSIRKFDFGDTTG